MADLSKMDLSFEENLGQTDPAAQFMSRGHGATYFLRKNGLVMGMPFIPEESRDHTLPASLDHPETVKQWGVHMNLAGANPDPHAAGEQLERHATTYVRQRESGEWKQTVKHYKRVRYQEVYDGIDLVYYGKGQGLEYDFVVKPGADPSRIRFSFEGVAATVLDADGSLVLSTELGALRHAKPYVYQDIGGRREPIEASYRLDDGAVTFELAEYRPDLPLVIDPAVVLSSLFGGSGFDIVNAVVADLVDPATDLEVFWFGGQVTSGTTLPGPGQSEENFDMFISGVLEVHPEDTAGLSPARPDQALIDNIAGTEWRSLGTMVIGGGAADIIRAMTLVEKNGRKYLMYAGSTFSPDFPAREATVPGAAALRSGPPGAAQNNLCRGVVGSLLESTELADDLRGFFIPAPQPGDIFVDGFKSGDVTVWSTGGPGLNQTLPGGGFLGTIEAIKPVPPMPSAAAGKTQDFSLVDFVITGIDKRGRTQDIVIGSGRLGAGTEIIQPLRVLSFGGPEDQFPAVSGLDVALPPEGGEYHAVVSGTDQQAAILAMLRMTLDGDFELHDITKHDTNGGSTFGGPAIAIHDRDGVHNIIQSVTGDATSLEGVRNASGTNLFNSWWLTFRYDRAGGPLELISNEAVGGPGGTTNFEGLIPGLKDDYFFAGSSDVNPQRLNPRAEVQSPAAGGYDIVMYNCIRTPDGALRRYGYRWGGRGNDFSRGITLDHWGNPFIVGYTNGNDFPIVDGAFQSAFAGGPWDGVLVKWKKPLICAITDAASFRPGCISPGGLLSVFGHWVGHRNLTIFELGPGATFSTELDGLEAYVLGSDDKRYNCVPLFGSKSQSNWVFPYDVPVGPARFCLIYRGVESYYYDINVQPYWPACFANNGYGAFISSTGVFNQAGVTYTPGTVIQSFGTQFGTPQTMMAITESASTTELNPLVEPVLVQLDPAAAASLKEGQHVAQGAGAQARVLFAGLAPGFTPGLQQLNFVVPNVPPGMYNVTFQTGDAVSGPVLIGVGAP